MSKEKSETKICRHCKTEIPYDAKVCPQCRKKQGGKLKWIVIAIAVLVVVGAAAGGGGDDKPKKVENTGENAGTDNAEEQEPDNAGEQTDQEEKPDGEKEDLADGEKSDDGAEEAEQEAGGEEETLFKKGETAEWNDVQVTLTDYKENKGSEYNRPSDGNVFLMAEFEIANNTDESIAISSLLSFEAYADDYKLDYSFNAILEKEGNQLDGEIAAGKKMKGWIGWEVPKDYGNVEIHFTENVWSGGKFVFLVEK